MNLPWTTKLTSGGAEVRTRVWWSLETKFLILGGAPLPSLPPKRSLWGWRSVGLRTCAAIGFPRCLPVCIPPCKLFASLPPFCERGLHVLVFFLSSKEARFLWVRFTAAAPGRDVSSHSVSGASLIWRDEWQSPGEEVKRRLLWVVPGPPSPALCPQGLRESVQPQHPGACFTASAAFPSWGPEALGHPGVQAGPGAACICGKWKQSWVWGSWVSHLELRPGSLQTQAPAMQADDNRR